MNTLPFDLEKAKQGHPVCTVDGRSVRLVCFDRQREGGEIVGLITNPSSGEESFIASWGVDGYFNTYMDQSRNLRLIQKTKIVYYNLYDVCPSRYFDTEEEANDYRSKDRVCGPLVAQIPIN
jgi:hypothetical protein